MREGTSYFFVHRSFQEYFTALFLSNCPEDIRDEFIDKVSSRYWDNVLPMLFDMASDQIEPSWVARNTDEYLQAVSDSDATRLSPLLARFSGLGFQKYGDDKVFFSSAIPGPYAKFVSVMRRFYPSLSQKTAEIDFEAIEAYAMKNWPKLLCENEVKHTITDGPTISIKNVTFDKMPTDLVATTGLTELAEVEYREIIKIRAAVDSAQQTKSAFLNRLFGSKT